MIRFLVLSSLILTLFLTAPAVEGDVSFRLSGATTSSYGVFISNLRKALPYERMLYDIPLLRSTLPGSQRYALIHLTNYADETISVAIDVTNVYIMGYRAGDTSYFFNEASATEAAKYVFKDAKRKVTLPYSGNYERLQTAAGKIRENIPLGLPALNSAITTLFYYNANSAASALLVLIQSTAEAARYKFIEQQIGKRVDKTFLPSLAIISLENSWSALSKQIQIASTNNGQFETPVVLINGQNQRVMITNVNAGVVTSNIALLLNRNNMAAIDDDVATTMSFGLGSYAIV